MRSVRINLTPRIVPHQRIPAIDELKGLAIALIISYHCGGVLGNPNVIHGEVGVDVFLILSGFTLAVTAAEMPLKQFFWRRFLRIYPSYWIALGLFIWMLGKFYNVRRSSEDVWHHVIGIHGFTRLAYFSDYADAYWFISMILAAYVVFALIRKRLDDLSLVFAVSGYLTVLATYLYELNGHTGGLISLAVRIPSFFAGVIAGQLLGKGTGEVKFNLFLGLGLLCFYVQIFFLNIASNYTLPAIGIILTWIALRTLVIKVPGGRAALVPIALLGVISYEVYLFHQPLVRDYMIYYYVEIRHIPSPSHWQYVKGIWAALGVTLVVSIVVHFLVGRLYALVPRKVPARPSTAP